MSGRIIKQTEIRCNAGQNNIHIDLAEVSSGIYTIQTFTSKKLTFTSLLRKL
jgi:hypothetical protein